MVCFPLRAPGGSAGQAGGGLTACGVWRGEGRSPVMREGPCVPRTPESAATCHSAHRIAVVRSDERASIHNGRTLFC